MVFVDLAAVHGCRLFETPRLASSAMLGNLAQENREYRDRHKKMDESTI